MPKYGFHAALKNPDYSPGQRRTVELRRRSVIAWYLLVVSWDHAVTGGSGAGAIYSDAVFRWIDRIELIVAGTARQVYSGQFLRILHKLLGQEEWPQTPPTSVAASASETGRRAYFALPLQMPHSFTPEEFGLPTQLAEDPTLAITWAQYGALFNELIDGVPAASNVSVELYEAPVLDPAIPAGSHHALEIRDTFIDITQSGTPRIELPHLAPGHELRAVIVEAFQGGTGGTDFEYSNSLISKMKLVINGKDVLDLVPFSVLQARNKVAYQLEAIETGVVVIDAAEDKRTAAGELFIIAGTEKPYLEVNAAKQSGECRIRVTTISVSTRLR